MFVHFENNKKRRLCGSPFKRVLLERKAACAAAASQSLSGVEPRSNEVCRCFFSKDVSSVFSAEMTYHKFLFTYRFNIYTYSLSFADAMLDVFRCDE